MPGLTACGSVIQRSTQSGFKRSFASRKLGAVAILSCCGIAGRVTFQAGSRRAREQAARHVAFLSHVSVGTVSGIYGMGCCESAWKKRTSFRSSLSENENVGMRTFR